MFITIRANRVLGHPKKGKETSFITQDPKIWTLIIASSLLWNWWELNKVVVNSIFRAILSQICIWLFDSLESLSTKTCLNLQSDYMISHIRPLFKIKSSNQEMYYSLEILAGLTLPWNPMSFIDPFLYKDQEDWCLCGL